MKLYATFPVIECDDELVRSAGAVWTTSASDASKAVTDMCKEHNLKRKEVKTAAIEVDARKEGLVGLLNSLTHGVAVVAGVQKLLGE